MQKSKSGRAETQKYERPDAEVKKWGELRLKNMRDQMQKSKSGGAETQKYERPDAEVKKWGGAETQKI